MDKDSAHKAERYRMQAEAVRDAAESVHLLSARESMLQIAHAYDVLAYDLLAEQVEDGDM